jgi:putative hemolysin
MTDISMLDNSASAPSDEALQFTYATQVNSKPQRALIRTLELLGGQPRLKKLYLQNERQPRTDETFFDAAVRLLRLDVSFDQSMLDLVPRDKPVVFIANHPYGVLDGITLTWLAMKARPDVKVLANSVLCQAPAARDNLLPIDFAPTEQARQTTIASRLAVQRILKEKGAIGIFPGGGVSAAMKPFKGPALELPWAPFTAKMVMMSGATVVPLWFEGQNSRAFQIASHLSYTVRLSLMFHETARRIGTRFNVNIGRPISFGDLPVAEGRAAVLGFMRERTLELAPAADRDALRGEFTKGADW